MWLGPIVLGVLALLAGLFVGSSFFAGQIIQPAAQAIAGEAYAVKLYLIPPSLALWHDGLPSPFALSLLTWLLGVGGYLLHEKLRPSAIHTNTAVSRFGPEVWYFKGLNGLLSIAAWLTGLIQNGHLRVYLTYVFVTLIGLAGFFLLPTIPTEFSLAGISIYEGLLVGMIILAVVMVILAKSRLAAVAAMGVVGYGIALLYVLFNAPDLAMTQFAIETLTVILFVLVLYRLPRFVTFSRPLARARDAFVAGSVGLLMFLFALTVTAVPTGTPLTDYFADTSYTIAKGRNVVNVILVDFRGLDTMVEITVLAVAAIGVYTLIQAKRK